MRNRLFPYGTQSQAVTTSVQFQEPDTNAVLSGTDDLDMEEGRMEEVIVTAFHQDIASRVFASNLSRDYGLCIILANPTEVEGALPFRPACRAARGACTLLSLSRPRPLRGQDDHCLRSGL